MPPCAGAMVVPFHTPVVIVPILAKLDNVVTAFVINVPLVGKVIAVAPLSVIAYEYAPLVENAPPNVIVEPDALETPVPPYAASITVPFHTPVAMVPSAVMLP